MVIPDEQLLSVMRACDAGKKVLAVIDVRVTESD